MDVVLGIFGILSGVLMIAVPIIFFISMLLMLDNNTINDCIIRLDIPYLILIVMHSMFILLCNAYFPIFSIIRNILSIIIAIYCINRIKHYWKIEESDDWKRIIYKLFNFDEIEPFTWQIILTIFYIINNIAFRFLYKYIMSGGFGEWMKMLTTLHRLMS